MELYSKQPNNAIPCNEIIACYEKYDGNLNSKPLERNRIQIVVHMYCISMLIKKKCT
jgi:hypothetical protein